MKTRPRKKREAPAVSAPNEPKNVSNILASMQDPRRWPSGPWPMVRDPTDPRFWRTLCMHLFEVTRMLRRHVESNQSHSSQNALRVVTAVERALALLNLSSAVDHECSPVAKDTARALRSLALGAARILKADQIEGDPMPDRHLRIERLSQIIEPLVNDLPIAARAAVEVLPFWLPFDVRQLPSESEEKEITHKTVARLGRLQAQKLAHPGLKPVVAEDVIREAGRAFGLTARQVHDWFSFRNKRLKRASTKQNGTRRRPS